MTKRASLGTAAWARATRGEMSPREQLATIGTGLRVVLGTVPAQLRQRLGFRNPRAFAYDLERLPLPDSRIAKEAEELCRASSPSFVAQHSYRTYAWGMILAAADGKRPDPELFFVAAMLHDLALEGAFASHAPEIRCFGARAALAAEEWALARGWTADRSTTLADAISLHLNVEVGPEHGPEAELLQAGAALDVIGLRHWDLAPETVDAVVGRYPRHQFKRDSYPLFAAQAHARTRTRLLDRWLQFGTLVCHSQFAE